MHEQINLERVNIIVSEYLKNGLINLAKAAPMKHRLLYLAKCASMPFTIGF